MKKILPVFEVKQPTNTPTRRNRLEETRRGLVGVDAGGREQADDAVGLDQAHRALDEERIEVDVAAAQQRVVPAGAHQLAEAVGAQLGRVELVRKGVARVAQRFDPPAAGGRGRRQRQLGRARGEPLDLLQLDAVPRRVADHRVEAALGPVVLPAPPDAGEGDLPV